MKKLRLALVLIFLATFKIAVSAQLEVAEEFYVEAEINGQKILYIQKNDDSIAVSNRYFPKYKIAQLQAYGNNDKQIVKIGIFNLKFDEIKTPFPMNPNIPANFSLAIDASGYNTKKQQCSPLDVECAFVGSSKSKTIQAVIKKLDYENKIIEGEFSGKIILLRIGSDVNRNYPDTFIIVKNGKFRINFRLGDIQ